MFGKVYLLIDFYYILCITQILGGAMATNLGVLRKIGIMMVSLGVDLFQNHLEMDLVYQFHGLV